MSLVQVDCVHCLGALQKGCQASIVPAINVIAIIFSFFLSSILGSSLFNFLGFWYILHADLSFVVVDNFKMYIA